MGQKADRCLCICWWSEASDWCSQVSLEIALLRRKETGSQSNAACIVNFPARSKLVWPVTAPIQLKSVSVPSILRIQKPGVEFPAAEPAHRIIARHRATMGFGKATWCQAAPPSGTVAMEFGGPLIDLPRCPKQLNQQLLALDQETKLLERLDGFIAALLA